LYAFTGSKVQGFKVAFSSLDWIWDFSTVFGGGGGCSAGVYQQIEKNMQKFFFISIHKLPASIRFAPLIHALAVTVEPLKFSSRQVGVAYELS
jgi:hypothetical protein